METNSACFPVREYDLAATLTSGQAFRWRRVSLLVPPSGGSPGRVNAGLQTTAAWEGVVRGRRVRLQQFPESNAELSTASRIEATTALPQSDWSWLTRYLRLHDDHAAMLATFPDDEPMRTAMACCRGLRLLRQETWECLASFILSSTKQIVQIQQCVELLCERFGEPLSAPGPAPLLGGVGGGSVHGKGPACFTFPSAARLAAATEAELRACKIGFRAKYLHAAARRVCGGELDLMKLETMPMEAAREELMRCPGVGRKIADCTLLFSCGFDAAFPVDVWVERALRQLYFPKRRVKRARLERFAATHFGPYAGLAQQYLFHYLRTGGSRRSAHHAH